MIKVSSVQAQNNFGSLLDSAQREPVVVTRHGRPAAFIVSPRDMEELLDARKRRSHAVARLQAWFAEADKVRTDEGRRLTQQDVVRLVKESR